MPGWVHHVEGGKDLDDVLQDANDPAAALLEAKRLLRPEGRLLLLAAVGDSDISELRVRFAEWATAASLRLASPRAIPSNDPAWLLAIATVADRVPAAA